MMDDCQCIAEDGNIPFSELEHKTVLITGATGLIGQMLVQTLCYLGRTMNMDITVIAAVRNQEKAERLFRDLTDSGQVILLVNDILQPISTDLPVDYILHTASQTSSKGFIHSPVETIHTAFIGTDNLLKLAAEKKIRKFVYLSTMEVYGTPETSEKITEDYVGNLNTMSVRSCYPVSKRMCENLCCSYSAEYGVPINVIRLTQTFGSGVTYDDGRVFAEFARCAVENRDIILHTSGKTERNYLYTADAVRAILTVMLKASCGEVYNAANEETYCSIREMAELVADKIADGKIKVRMETSEPAEQFGYAPVLHMNLDTSRLKALGWKPAVDLEEAYRRMISYWKKTK